jgi:hypothetical protein
VDGALQDVRTPHDLENNCHWGSLIDQLASLDELRIQMPMLTELPRSLSRLTSLAELSLDTPKLVRVPQLLFPKQINGDFGVVWKSVRNIQRCRDVFFSRSTVIAFACSAWLPSTLRHACIASKSALVCTPAKFKWSRTVCEDLHSRRPLNSW